MASESATQIKPLSTANLLNQYVKENIEVLETDGKELVCKICKKSISYATTHSVERHLTSKQHNKSIEAESKMAKSCRPLATELLNKYVSENAEIFKTDGKLLYCKLCKKSVSFDTKSAVNQHLRTQKHKLNFAQSIGKTSDDNMANKHLAERKQFALIWEKNEDFCRTCMKQFSKAKQKDFKQNITEIPAGFQDNTSIMELLEIIQPQIKVEIKNKFPTLICSDCVQKLLVSYEFIKMYQNVDKKLHKMLEEFDIENCNINSDSDSPSQLLEEVEVPVDFETNKYHIEIEQVNICNMEKEMKDEPIPEMSDGAENDESNNFLNPYSEASDENWLPDENCLNASIRENNSDDVTKKVFKGFFQPEKNDDGTLTCQLCETDLNGVAIWREHMRQLHLENKPKRAYNRNKQREKGTQKQPKKNPPNKDGVYQCEYCEKSYPKYLFYRRHLRKHTEEPHLCIECGKSFSLLTSYTSHMLRHKGEKTFQCPHCPKSFVCSSGLYNHAITHTSHKPYICDTCGSAFHMSYQLKKHNRIHLGIKKYQCEYCDMRFITGEKQRRHMRTHTGEKPYRCKYCERAFAQSNDCVKHLRQHLGDNVYQCDLCPLRYPLLRELRVHFASHKGDDEETRARNLQARMEAEKNLQIKLGSTDYSV